MKKLKKKEHRIKLTGFWFVLPWLIGVIVFNIRPLVESVIYSFSNVYLTVQGLEKTFIGIENYYDLFFVSTDFTRNLISSVGETLYRLPLILVLSIFLSILLNKSFKGRLFFRGVFFLPIIIASGYVISIINGSATAAMLSATVSSDASDASTAMMTIDSIKTILLQFGVSESVQEGLIGYVSNIFNLLWYSGIQILLFLAALQGIPASLREVANIEGITEWQYFWKITLPMISPTIMINIVYTIVDGFTDTTNTLMNTIYSYTQDMKFGSAAAMAWVYFAVILVLLGLVFLIMGKRIFYMND